MNPQPHQNQPLPERVAVMENAVDTLKQSILTIAQVQEHQGGMLNSICVNMATLTPKLQQVLEERSRWKDPMLYITACSVLVAAYAVWHH